MTFNCNGLFLAFATEDSSGFVGIARSPDYDSGKTGQATLIEVLRVTRVDATTLRTSFSRSLDVSGTRFETWKFANEPRPDGGTQPGAPGADPSLPKFGEYVYVEELPDAIERVPPDYPRWARERGIQGTVMVQALVGRDGLVKDTRVVGSIPGLDDYAVGAVKQWRFKPASSKGEPVAVWVGIPVKFSLH